MLIYKSKAKKEKNIKYTEWADEMEHLAVQILEKFYLTNPSKCKQAIIRAVPEFNNVTWLQLAVMAESKLFIAKQGVQDVLHDIWYLYLINMFILFYFVGMVVLIIQLDICQ
jgi:hypothetical protein